MLIVAVNVGRRPELCFYGLEKIRISRLNGNKSVLVCFLHSDFKYYNSFPSSCRTTVI